MTGDPTTTGSAADRQSSAWSRWRTGAGRPAGRWVSLLVVATVSLAPAWLFFSPISSIPRNPLRVYLVFSDDFPYLAQSRTWQRTLSNLFVPHNAHIVPAWRIVSWVHATLAGSLEATPGVLAAGSYLVLVAAMLLAGWIVRRETGRTAAGLAAMAVAGTTSVMQSATIWYSAGQATWAGCAVLVTVALAQSWRFKGGSIRLVAAALAAALGGWFWTVGYIAGPVGAVYLWLSGRRGGRWAAVLLVTASVAAAGLALSLGGHAMATPVAFHGRTARQAADPWHGLQHTLQAIPENLVLGNLALAAETTAVQGALLTGGLVVAWLVARRGPLNPLEAAGAAQVVSAYLFEWTFRGYLPYASLRGLLAHYDVVPHLGAVLFVGGWFAGLDRSSRMGDVPLSRRAALGVLVLLAVLVGLHRTRTEQLWRHDRVPPLTRSEQRKFPIPELQWMRNSAVALDRAAWQRRHLARLDRAEATASRLHIDRAMIHHVFGRVAVPELPPDSDAVDLLVLPAQGSETDPARVFRALGQDFVVDPEPRPQWLDPGETWPPPVTPPAE